MQVLSQEQVAALRSVAEALESKGIDYEAQVLRGVLASVEGEAGDEFTAAEAAAILGVTQQTIRNWVRGKIVPGRQDPTRHFFVSKEALRGAQALRSALPQQTLDATDDEIDTEIEAVRAERRARPER